MWKQEALYHQVVPDHQKLVQLVEPSMCNHQILMPVNIKKIIQIVQY